MAFCGERSRLDTGVSGIFNVQMIKQEIKSKLSAKELQRALWTGPPAVRVMPGIPRWLHPEVARMIKWWLYIYIRKLDSRGRQKIRKDCDEVFPQIIIGTGDCIKDVSFIHSISANDKSKHIFTMSCQYSECKDSSYLCWGEMCQFEQKILWQTHKICDKKEQMLTTE